MLIIIANGAKAIWGSDAYSYPTIGSTIRLGSIGITTNSLLVVVITALVMVLLNLFLTRRKSVLL